MIVIKIIIVISPWFIKRKLLKWFFNYKIEPTAYIGLSWFFPSELEMEDKSFVGHFNTAIHLDKIKMDNNASIGQFNWITGFSTKTESKHFAHQKKERYALLHLKEHAAITKHHHIDCTNKIEVGAYATIAGYYSQLLTHSINIKYNRQDSSPIYIGDYCFVGTNVVILGGSSLPAYSVLGAKSLLNKEFTEEYMLYGGVPCKALQPISKDAKYFLRTEWFVY